MLGEGGFASVYRTTRIRTDETYATKVIKIKDMVETMRKRRETVLKALRDETDALKLLRGGPHIIRLLDVFEESDKMYMVMEEMKGGDLLQRIVKKDVYTEREARQVCQSLFQALDYCHKKRIAHRDIKLENILLMDYESDSRIKIADFGFAKRVPLDGQLWTCCGSPNYVAPEILALEGYDEQCDNWSAGVVTFLLLAGYAPFDGTTSELFQIIPTGKYRFFPQHWAHVSTEAKQVVIALLKVDPNERITAEQVLQSGWMSVEEERLSVTDLSSAQDRIRRSLPTDKLRSAVQAVIATNKFSSLGIDDNAGSGAQMGTITEHHEEAEKTFSEVYDIGDEVGTGSCSTVFAAVHKETKTEYTVKRIDRRYLDPEDAVAVQDEMETLRELKGCANIVNMFEVYEELDYGYVIMERMTGGDLLSRVSVKEVYTEADAKTIVANLLSGVQHCHERRIANRNIQANNLFLVSQESDTDIKITDFGFAKKVTHPNSLRTLCGTLGYVAPEILSHMPAYDVPCDIWSLGVILFLLLGGYRPFRADSDDETMELTRYGTYEFHDLFWSHISEDAKDLIRRMLTVDPRQRITAAEALESPWIKASDDELCQFELAKTQKELQALVAMRKVRGVVKVIIASKKLQSLGRRHRAFRDF